MLEIKDLRITFNRGTINEKPALCGVSLNLEKGDFLTVIGGNGAGKSTLLNTIAGVYSVDEGSVTLDGLNLTKLPDFKRAKYISRVFQDPLLGTAGNMNLEENLSLALKRGKRRSLKWYISPTDRATFKQLLMGLDLGLEERLNQKVGTLSGGQRQAVTLLMASMADPKLMLLDEHTAALDPKTAIKVLNLTQKIVANDSNLITVMITHNMSDAIKYGNKLIMMDRGKIIYSAEGEEKAKLTVPFLMQKFEATVGDGALSDKMLLS